MFRIVRVPASLDKFFHTLRPRFHWDHFHYFRLLVLVMALAWGRRHVTNWFRYLDAQHHRTRFNHFFLVQRWDPEAALLQKAGELPRVLHPQPGETPYLIIDDSKKAKWGKSMDAVTKMKDPTIDAYIRGHQYVCGILVCHAYVLPYGIRLSVKKAHCAALECPFRKTTELAAAGLIQTYDKCWTIEPWVKDVKQPLGLGQDQNHPYRAAVIHLPLVCFAYALLTHLRIERYGAQGQRTRKKAADLSTAAAQD